MDGPEAAESTCDEYVTYTHEYVKANRRGSGEKRLKGCSVVSTGEVRSDDDDLDAVWKALGNRTRRRILDLLIEGPSSTSQLSDAFDELSRFAVMQHLAVLRDADLVIAVKQGRSRVNHLNPVPIQQIGDRWISRYQRPLAEALIDLKLSLESEGGDVDSGFRIDPPSQEPARSTGALP